jgi:hypothetical protein
MGLKHNYFSTIRPASRCGRQRGCNLTGVMGIIVYKKGFAIRQSDIPENLESPVDSAEFAKPIDDRLCLYPYFIGDRNCGERITNVV